MPRGRPRKDGTLWQPKTPPEVTGDTITDISIEDMSRSLFRAAKEMRHVMQTAAGITLWDTTKNGDPLEATKAKAGHHPLVVILIEQAQEYASWKSLDQDAKGDIRVQTPDGEWVDADALDKRIKIATGKQKSLEALRETCLKIQTAGASAMSQANDLIAKLQNMAQVYQMHREKMKADDLNISPADLEAKLARLEKA